MREAARSNSSYQQRSGPGGRDRDSRDNREQSGPGGNKKVFFRHKKSCPLSEAGAPKIDYKDVRLLSKFISERGKILPRRITSVSAKKQRELANAIKQARNIALLPFVSQ